MGVDGAGVASAHKHSDAEKRRQRAGSREQVRRVCVRTNSLRMV